MASKYEGIEIRHQKGCRSMTGARCGCHPSYRASVYNSRTGGRVKRTFPTLAAAKNWRADARVASRQGTLRDRSTLRVDQAAIAWLDGAEAGSIRNRSGDLYKPSVLRSYRQAIEQRIIPALGGYRLADLRRSDLQDFADILVADGLSASTVRNTINPLRKICGRAVARNEIGANPTTGLELPAVRGKRDRIASPEEAQALLDALEAEDRPLWATALYGGLRLGELLALRWSDVDLGSGLIRVERGWDPKVGAIATKSGMGKRRVPIAAVLRDYLTEHRLRSSGEGMVFGRGEDRPFNPKTVRRRANAAWTRADLACITLHECRHTFASLMIAADVNAKALSTYLGHSSIQITFDRYGHLMPGNENEAAGLLDAYLERANSKARIAQSRADVPVDVPIGHVGPLRPACLCGI